MVVTLTHLAIGKKASLFQYQKGFFTSNILFGLAQSWSSLVEGGEGSYLPKW